MQGKSKRFLEFGLYFTCLICVFVKLLRQNFMKNIALESMGKRITQVHGKHVTELSRLNVQKGKETSRNLNISLDGVFAIGQRKVRSNVEVVHIAEATWLVLP